MPYKSSATNAMSIDLNWEAATSGPDGEQLAERIRSFIHDKFQQVPLPRFIRSVNVHSFEFGSIAPELEIKDICDPFADFYEESGSEDEEDDGDHDADGHSDTSSDRATTDQRGGEYEYDRNGHDQEHPMDRPDHLRTSQWVTGGHHQSAQSPLRSPIGLGDHLNAPFRSATPSILPGVTSNLGYHLMMGNLSGTQTPLAAVAGGTPYGLGWPDAVMHGNSRMASQQQQQHGLDRGRTDNDTNNKDNTSSPSRPSTANTNPTQLSHKQSAAGSSSNNTSNDPTVIYNDHASSTTATAHEFHEGHQSREKQTQAFTINEEAPPSPTPHMRERRPEDFQVICRMKYAGDVKLSLTAEILLDYPMPSFVGLPLKLNITGITFDGVAVVAYIRRRAHLCFLSPEDADALLGDDEDDIQNPQQEQQPQQRPYSTTNPSQDNPNNHNSETQALPHPKRRFGSLLQQIRVDSEIGRKENGKQALKNVGKVERFVLDQVRRIFEDEFVFPSFWTFLV